MPRSDSPLLDRMIFAFGAQRSGTFWLQRILTGHPQISAVPSESNLFSLGIAPLFERFHHGLKTSPTVGSMHVERELLLDATRDFCDRVLLPYLDPEARYLSERTPGHSRAAGLITEIYPDARLVHIVRDGRDVARSLAAREWGPGTIAEAARTWRDDVLAARSCASHDRYLELRYEDLLADPEQGISELFGWLALPTDDESLAPALSASRRLINHDPKDPRAATGKWRDHFTAADLDAFEHEAGELLAELGYADGARAQPQVAEGRAAAPTSARSGPRGGPRLRLGRLLRRTPVRPSAPSWEVGGEMAKSQALADDLLSRLHRAAGAESVRELLHPDVRLSLTTADDTTLVLGAEAVAEVLAADPAWGGRQLVGENHPGTPNYSLVLVYELADGLRAARVLQLVMRRGFVEVVALYQIALAVPDLERSSATAVGHLGA